MPWEIQEKLHLLLDIMRWMMQLLRSSGNHLMKLRISITSCGEGNTAKYPKNLLCECGPDWHKYIIMHIQFV